MAEEIQDLGFANPDEFPSYDEVESEDGQAELPIDSFVTPETTSDDEPEFGCCVR